MKTAQLKMIAQFSRNVPEPAKVVCSLVRRSWEQYRGSTVVLVYYSVGRVGRGRGRSRFTAYAATSGIGASHAERSNSADRARLSDIPRPVRHGPLGVHGGCLPHRATNP
jgi:hypothetical protein